jgi:succinate-semialdehyde dehydrogenase/glutarate-semialdehyde dehydrogenase
MATRPPAASSTRTIAVTNPATGEHLADVPVHSSDEVHTAIARARAAQPAWGALPVRERGRRMLAFRDALVAHAEELCDILVRENGKTRTEALFMELAGTVDLATYYARRAPRVLGRRRIPLHLLRHRTSYVHYVPRGVVGVIAPWNFPLSIPVGETIMALLAGNAVVLKPSEVTPLIALRVKKLFDETGIDPRLFQIVTGDAETGRALVESGVDMIVFTGSVATGRVVAEACARRLIPCVLELGGKAPAVVCADADLERTARALVWGGFANSGQVCVSVERVYAVGDIAAPLEARLAALAMELRQGDPARGDVDVGAIPFAPQLETVTRHVEGALTSGARALAGGAVRPGAGRFYSPTVLVDVRQDMDVMRKETFGAVLPVMRVASEDEAVRLANDSHLGLMGYVFSRDTRKARRLAESLRVGTVMINDVLGTYAAPETPWHGLKESGVGVVHSDDGLRSLCETRHVNAPRFPWPFRRELFWYPYSERTYRRGLSLLRLLWGRGRAARRGSDG